mmetsp:Transcript_24176/g.55611  ORF Transcript_24176/g.55611 Transcript_24176/m.55611 type:complete len:305 (-) Transcript_24176:660-1574(-)
MHRVGQDELRRRGFTRPAHALGPLIEPRFEVELRRSPVGRLDLWELPIDVQPVFAEPVTAHHQLHQHARGGPHVGRGLIRHVVHHRHRLGRYEAERAGHIFGPDLPHTAAEVEVDQLDPVHRHCAGDLILSVVDEDVLALDVAVRDPARVEVAQRAKHRLDHRHRDGLAYPGKIVRRARPHEVEDVAPAILGHDEEHAPGGLERLLEVENVCVALRWDGLEQDLELLRHSSHRLDGHHACLGHMLHDDIAPVVELRVEDLAEVSLSNEGVEAHGVWPYVVDRALFVLFDLAHGLHPLEHGHLAR